MASQPLPPTPNATSPTPPKNPPRPQKTYIYKLTIDDGVAPHAPPPTPTTPALPTLAICKPAIRRTARPNDLIIGITSITLAKTHRYPLNAIVYIARVAAIVPGKDYTQPPYSNRLDSIYAFSPTTRTFTRRQTSTSTSPSNANAIHTLPSNKLTDLGHHPTYKNAHVLLCTSFRYFGTNHAVPIPPSSYPGLYQLSQEMGRWHRVVSAAEHEMASEVEGLAKGLWERETGFTSEAALVGGRRRRGGCGGGKRDGVGGVERKGRLRLRLNQRGGCK